MYENKEDGFVVLTAEEDALRNVRAEDLLNEIARRNLEKCQKYHTMATDAIGYFLLRTAFGKEKYSDTVETELEWFVHDKKIFLDPTFSDELFSGPYVNDRNPKQSLKDAATRLGKLACLSEKEEEEIEEILTAAYRKEAEKYEKGER